MSMTVFTNSFTRFLRDRSARLATLPLHTQQAKQWLAREQRDEARASSLLIVGLIAALYVAARIGLTYVALPH
jgi:hypothetical protein